MAEDAGEKHVEDEHHHHHPQQHQQAAAAAAELSDDNPIENDVEHTTDGQKSASADSGAEEVGSPEQQATHGNHTVVDMSDSAPGK